MNHSCVLRSSNVSTLFFVSIRLFNVIKVRERQSTKDRFLKHASSLGSFVDSLVQLLGPDTFLLQSTLIEIGLQTSLLGPPKSASEHFLADDDASSLLLMSDGSSIFTYLGDAMILVMEEALDRDFTLQEQTAFDEVYYLVTQEIQSAMAETYDDKSTSVEPCPNAMQASLNSFNSSFGSLGSFAE
mmetsp:Transcript_5296/g.11714  ORF Transcript_5296/g.11714 Transcript_5296/m.11714 type:complete len:186 (-) Transcript_5296:197-754(-)